MIVGITGGIGVGKSSVAAVFAALAIPCYNSDERAKELLNSDSPTKAAIISLFGESSYIDGQLNRPYISAIVFQDKHKLEQLNSIVHPAIASDSQLWADKQFDYYPYVLKEAAIMVETGGHKKVDKLIVVDSPLSIRIKRLMDYRSMDFEAIEKRIAAQMPQEEKLAFADYRIDNDGVHSLIKQVCTIHEELVAQSKLNRL
ncbi:dephospho-CoA kinase [Chitinophagales bacterium]|nr:dephospho-CoA kinase [Chitinophagales bacterium]